MADKEKSYIVIIKDDVGRLLVDTMTSKKLIQFNKTKLNDFPYMVIDGVFTFEGSGYSAKGDCIKNYDEELDIDKLTDII